MGEGGYLDQLGEHCERLVVECLRERGPKVSGEDGNGDECSSSRDKFRIGDGKFEQLKEV